MSLTTDSFGLIPANITWNVVRGDTAQIFVEFLQNDEATSYDISDWTFSSNAYDFKGDIIDELITDSNGLGVTITAPEDITQYWGTGYNNTVAELAFDLQVDLGNRIWTPLVGTIKVLADVTGAL
jgi:hypothetical protein